MDPGPTPGSDEIDYRLIGEEMQAVIVTLDPGEQVLAEAGSMLYMTEGVDMQTNMSTREGRGFFGGVFEGIGRVFSGEGFFITTFTNLGRTRADVAFAAPYPGKILPLDLTALGKELLCQKDAFLCAARGTEISVAFQKKVGTGLFGGEGFLLQRLRGEGLAFIHAGGTVFEIELAEDQPLRLDTGCLVAFQAGVDYRVEWVGGVRNALFGGEGFFFATLSGPGRVYLQTLPFSRLADRISWVGRLLGRR